MSQIAHDESARLTRLTNDFLAYARNRPPQLKRIAAANVCDAVAGLARARASEAGVQLQLDCSSDDLPIDADELQLHQAILNLVTNAIEATPAGGTVTIGARPAADSGVDLFVADTAGPIPAQTADRLFEPFYTTKSTGTGLGLSIARSIAVAHDGDLRLTENRPGRVCFTLHLPPPHAPPVTDERRTDAL
jgi:signal transduction histidine kinase